VLEGVPEVSEDRVVVSGSSRHPSSGGLATGRDSIAENWDYN
jgi:hypothetical protein